MGFWDNPLLSPAYQLGRFSISDRGEPQQVPEGVWTEEDAAADEDDTYDQNRIRANGAALPVGITTPEQRFVALPEVFINKKLAELHSQSPALRQLNYRRDSSSFTATLKPFRVLIPPGSDAAKNGIVYLILNVENGIIKSPSLKEISVVDWELAFKCDLNDVNPNNGNFSIEHLLWMLSSVSSGSLDTENSRFGKNTEGQRMTYQQWLDTATGYQSKTNFSIFIQDWTSTCRAKGQTSFGHTFSLSSTADLSPSPLPFTKVTLLSTWEFSDSACLIIANTQSRIERGTKLAWQTMDNLAISLKRSRNDGLFARQTLDESIIPLMTGFKALCGNIIVATEDKWLLSEFLVKSGDADEEFRYGYTEPETSINAIRNQALVWGDDSCGKEGCFNARKRATVEQEFYIGLQEDKLNFKASIVIDVEYWFTPNDELHFDPQYAGEAREMISQLNVDVQASRDDYIKIDKGDYGYSWAMAKLGTKWRINASKEISRGSSSNITFEPSSLSFEMLGPLQQIERAFGAEVGSVGETLKNSLRAVEDLFRANILANLPAIENQYKGMSRTSEEESLTKWLSDDLIKSDNPGFLAGNLAGGKITDIALSPKVQITGNEPIKDDDSGDPSKNPPSNGTKPPGNDATPPSYDPKPPGETKPPPSEPPTSTPAPSLPTPSLPTIPPSEGRLHWALEHGAGAAGSDPALLSFTLRGANMRNESARFKYLQVRFTAGDVDADLFANGAAISSAASADKTIISLATTVSPTPALTLSDAVLKKGQSFYTAEVSTGGDATLAVPANGSLAIQLTGQRGVEDTHEVVVVELWANESGGTEDRKEIKFKLQPGAKA